MKEHIETLKAMVDLNKRFLKISANQKANEEITQQTEALQAAIELMQMHEDGRLVELPCKVGDTVYDKCGTKIDEGTVTGLDIWFVCTTGCFGISDFGKTVFLTEEAANEAKEKPQPCDGKR